MTLLVLGLIVFLGTHVFTMARGMRAGVIAKIGEGPYKGLYSLAALAGLVLIVIGFGQYRQAGYIPLWDPPVWTRHLSLPLVWISFVCLASAKLPMGWIRYRLKHPMLASVKIWAFAHLIANGDLGSILVFGSFLAWAVVARISVKYRDEAAGAGMATVPQGWLGDILAVVIGTLAYLAFVFWLHVLLIGVPVMPVPA